MIKNQTCDILAQQTECQLFLPAKITSQLTINWSWKVGKSTIGRVQFSWQD